MKKIFLSLAAAICMSLSIHAQCGFSYNYSSSAGWTTYGSCTCLSFGPSSFNFNTTPGGGYDYATTTTPCVLNDSCWCADIDFTYTARSTSGVAHTLLSFTSNTLNSWNGPSYTVSNNNDIEAYLLSPLNGPPGSECIFGQSKFGTIWSGASTGIPVTIGNTYYIRLQRLSPTQGLISVFTNAARTIQAAGSPQCFNINAGVTGLGILQHGAIPQAGAYRTMTGSLSNLVANSVNTGIKGMPALFCGKIIGSTNLCVAPVCGASSYTWSGPTGFAVTSGQGTPCIAASIGNSGTVTCTIAFPGASCGITYTVSYVHGTAPTLSVSASPSSTVCYGSSTTLTASGTSTSYSWLPTTGLSNPNIANPVANPTVTTTYTVTGTSATGCTRTATITVTVDPPLTANAGPNDSTCCGSIWYLGSIGGSASGGTPFTSGPPYLYSWSPTTNFSGCTNCPNPPVMSCSGPPGIVTYTLTVTDALGCTATSTVSIWYNFCRLANPNLSQQNPLAIASDLSVTPNPTNGNFVITFPGAEVHDVEVLDLIGQTVYSKSGITDASLTVDLSTQPKGIYFVKCKEGNQIFVQRIIIQ